MAGRTYGYARVSTQEQNLDRQTDALVEWGVAPADIFSDKVSGKDFERSEYRRLVEGLHEGDVLVVKSIDRLGRNYDEILGEWRRITKETGASVVVLDMPLLVTCRGSDDVTSALISDIVLQLLSYVAQVERENIHQRQAEGIASAQARGVKFGRPRIMKPKAYKAAREAYLTGHITRAEVAIRCKVSVSTVDRWLKADVEKAAEHIR